MKSRHSGTQSASADFSRSKKEARREMASRRAVFRIRRMNRQVVRFYFTRTIIQRTPSTELSKE